MDNIILTEHGIFEIDPNDCWVRNHIVANSCVYEYHIIKQLKDTINKSNFIVDVGANIGCHTISYGMFNSSAKIWAFEPQKKLFEILERNVQRNLLRNVELFNCGVGHMSMELELDPVEIMDNDQISGGYNKAGLGIGKGGEKMNIITLDSLNLPGLDYMKIDVEGAEGLVIMGARETIKKYKPVIFFEHNHKTINPTRVNLDHVPTPFEELVKLGYKMFQYIDWENYITWAS
jgi:FkbM family methyltransferase